jgi:hypothetical protein
MVQYISYLLILVKIAIQLGSIIQYSQMLGIPRKLAALIQMYLNKVESTLVYANISPQNFPFRRARNRMMFHHHCFPTLLRNMHLGGSKRNRKG